MRELRQHWETTAEQWQRQHHQSLWRRHSDAVNLELVKNWWPDEPADRVLKTDLFDEAFGEGLYPFIHSRAKSVIGIDISMEEVVVTAGGGLIGRPHMARLLIEKGYATTDWLYLTNSTDVLCLASQWQKVI